MAEHYREAAKRTIGELSPPMARLRLHLDNNVETAEELIAAMLARRSHPGNRVLVALVKLLEKRGPHLTP